MGFIGQRTKWCPAFVSLLSLFALALPRTIAAPACNGNSTTYDFVRRSPACCFAKILTEQCRLSLAEALLDLHWLRVSVKISRNIAYWW